jgi:hypothetical protein
MEIKNIYKEIIPFITFLLYIFGGIYYVTYYSSFGIINIISYISATEILILPIEFIFINMIEMFVIEFILCIFVWFVIPKILYFIPQKHRRKEEVPYLESSFGCQLFFLIFGSMLLIFISANFYFWLWLPAFFILFIIKLYLLLEKEEKEQIIKQYLLKIIFVVCVIIYAFTIFYYAYKDSQNVLSGSSTQQVEIIMENKTYLTNDKGIFFIGETTANYFLYDKNNNNTIIIEKNRVIECILHNQAMNVENTNKIFNFWRND